MTDDERRIQAEKIQRFLGQNGELDDNLRRIRSLGEIGTAQEFHTFAKSISIKDVADRNRALGTVEQITQRNAEIREIVEAHHFSIRARTTIKAVALWFTGVATAGFVLKDFIVTFFSGLNK